jgi:putative DNA primase/helicase
VARGAEVFTVDLPDMPGVNGADDFLYLQGPDAFAEVLAGRKPFIPLWRDPQFILQCLDQDELGDAELFAERFRGKFVHDHTAKAWYRFEGHAWTEDRKGTVFPTCSKTLRRLYLDCSMVLADEARRVAESVGPGDDDTDAKKRVDELSKKMKRLRSRAFALNRTKRTANVLQFAQSLDDIGVTGEVWDADTWLLAVENGVIDLKAGTLRPGRPEDFIRTVAPTRFDGLNTPCPTFERFLASTFDGPNAAEIVPFLHRLLGYSITGQCVEHKLPILYGEEGRNGKDTLLKAVKHVVGPFALAAEKEVLLVSRDRSAGGASPHLVALQGKRVVWVSETNDGARLDSGQTKLLTGGGQIAARQVFKESCQFRPTHTIFLLTNRKPTAPDDDSALWSRLVLIPFNLRFVDDEPNGPNERPADQKLEEKLEAEASGILAWLVRGALEWQRDGLKVPNCVKTETKAYRAEQDTVSQFLDECCRVDPKAFVPAGKLFEAYQAWADSAGIRKTAQKNHTAFGKRVAQAFEKVKGNKGAVYYGIGLLTEWESEKSDGSDGSDGSLQTFSHGKTQNFTFEKACEMPSLPSLPSPNGDEKAATGGRKRVKV